MAALQSMAFDSDGNMYIVDRYNYRILKFLLTSSSSHPSESAAIFKAFAISK